MKYLFLEYPKCSTCIKAKKMLDNNNINYDKRNIVIENPSTDEISDWIVKYNLDIKKLFNTSGMLYKDMKLKDRINDMSNKEKIELLASSGMLVKRPILVGGEIFLNGFNESKWKDKLEVK